MIMIFRMKRNSRRMNRY